ncbi:hypothetical protein L2E82_51872 [Cichorium intybus]|nr:hypothetical protein L2E82_51872 [Cichorium intybus]
MTYNYVISDLPFYKAALHDDWESVSQIFEQDPDLMTKQITYWWETPLIIAVGTNQSHNFVNKLVERIVAVGAKDKLFVTSYGGNNPLHYAAKVGNTMAARLLVEHNPDMTRVRNPYGNTPLKLAAWHGNKDTLRYLLTVTPDLPPPGGEGTGPYTGVAGGDLITLTIMAGFYDVAFEIIDQHPNIVLEQDRNSQTALQILALKPEIFLSGRQLGFWSRFIYSYLTVGYASSSGQVDGGASSSNKEIVGSGGGSQSRVLIRGPREKNEELFGGADLGCHRRQEADAISRRRREAEGGR